jgi:L-ribulose-5-phosphate 3-epimerase
MTTRRDFVRTGIAAAGGLALAGVVRERLAAQQTEAKPMKIGMCDWSLGKRADIAGVSLAGEIGLDGIEVSLGVPGNFPLRDPAVREAYLAAGKEHGVEFPSMALGCLNQVPLKSEPVTALWVADCIEAASALGSKVILLAFFGKGELRMEDEEDIQRVVDVLKELAPRAADASVILGLENTLSAEDNMQIIERVGHHAVKVYYDFKNSANAGRDTAAEVRALGDLICQVHLKNGRNWLEQIDNVDFAQSAQALKDIGYDWWLVLETGSPNDVVTDTRRNIEYVRKTF